MGTDAADASLEGYIKYSLAALGAAIGNNKEMVVTADIATDGKKTLTKGLRKAQCRLAIESQENDLQPTLGGEIIAERIEGAIDLKYAEGTNTGAPNFAWLKGLLSGLIDISEGFAINTFAMR